MKTIDLIPKHEPAEFELPGGFSARVKCEPDTLGEPWKEHDGHGPVSDWRPKESKRAGERVLCEDRGRALFYDFAEACKIARRDGWGSEGDAGLSKGAKAARAAEADFKNLHDWCNDKWRWIYVWVRVTAPDIGEQATASCGGIEDYTDYWREVAADLVEQCLHELAEKRHAANVRRCFC
jgi:hypothetical protein